MKSTMMSSPLLVNSMLERASALFPDVSIVAMQPDGSRHSYTYRDLRRRSRQLAAALEAAGICQGDRVATLMWNGHAHLEAYFGVPITGAVLHTLNLRLHPEEVAHIANHARDRFLIVDDVLLDLFEQIRPRVDFERVFVVDHGSGRLPEGAVPYEDFLMEGSAEPSEVELVEDDAAALCYTSGTTGCPKGVLYSHRAIALHSLAISLPDQLNFSRNDTVLPIVPMFHVNSWGFPYAAAMNGSKQVLPGCNLKPEALLDLLQNEGVTLAGGVPTIWMGVLNTLERHPGRWKLPDGLRLIAGGSATPESLFRRFDKLGVHLMQAWGMTETTPVGTATTLKPHMKSWTEDQKYAQRAKQGLPLPFIEMRTVGDEGETARDGVTTGELQVRGPWIAGSYYNLNQADKWTDDGWFRTGDVGTIDSEGYLKITDRLKDLIKSGGEWISSVDLENALVAHEAVREAAVIAVPHSKWQERPLALVILKDGCVVDASELRIFLERRFPRWHVPDGFVFVNELPHTSTGKLLKSKLRQDFGHYLGDVF
jgi:fatty-acyl-CoA synthase